MLLSKVLIGLNLPRGGTYGVVNRKHVAENAPLIINVNKKNQKHMATHISVHVQDAWSHDQRTIKSQQVSKVSHFCYNSNHHHAH